MALYPIPTTRSSQLLSQTRLTSQVQSDALDILRLQAQISSGYRLQAPSDDPAAALRAQGIQRLLELKSQVKTNISTGQSFIGATDSAVNDVATLLSNARAIAVGAADSTISESQRKASATEVERILQQVVDAGNQQFRGRYLFAGSKTEVKPFELVDGKVVYRGNEGSLRTFGDSDLLIDSSVNGNAFFGALSAEQKGSADLNPILTASTRLADLNGGRGVSGGSLLVSDGTSNVTVSLRGAETIGDVAQRLEASAPTGRTLSVRITRQGLELSLDSAGGGELTVREVGGGTTAAELGIASQSAIGTGPIVGRDLNPTLRGPTFLRDILGLRATGLLASTGTNNDIRIEAKSNGAFGNGATVQYVNDALLHASPGLAAGGESVSYSASAVSAQAALSFSGTGNNLLLTASSSGTSLNGVQIVVDSAGAVGDVANVTFDATNKILHVAVDSTGATQVQTVIAAINSQGTFAAASDLSDPTDGAFVATNTISASDIGAVAGNTGNSGAAANTFRVFIDPGATNANHVVAALTANATFAASFTASLDEEDGASTAFAGQGLVQLASTATTSGGVGEELDLAHGIQIKNGGQTFNVDVSGANTVEELLNALNGSNANVLAEINDSGTGINIRSRLSGADLSIGENGGTAATQLGVRTFTTSTELSKLNYGKGITASGGVDFSIKRNDGVTIDINLSGAQTIGDVIDLINNNPNNTNPATRVVARLASVGNGIEIVDDNPTSGGGSLSILKGFGSDAANQLGLIPPGQTTSTASTPAIAATANLAFPSPNNTNTALRLTAATAGTALNGVNVVFQNTLTGDLATAAYNSGTNTLTISLDSTATTANTVLTAINTDGTFAATLDLSSDATNNGSGIVGATGTLATTSGGRAETFTSTDVNPIEIAGTFTSLVRLRDALNTNDSSGIERAVALLDNAFDEVNFARAEIGSRAQTLDALSTRLADEEIELKKNLSDDIDVDFAEAVSQLQARQSAYQASLQLSAQIFKLTLLDFL